ncbi:PEP-CTERM sorting domain-containing protein [Prosthecobacter sp. SYSU 5D2]|uniref:PEP-CTERM sorting domain-containing protein n=1 Tax=Prosthecobacter sp. SYSU 5D2 TaxID=3134134 RepID=UPI0031FEC178
MRTLFFWLTTTAIAVLAAGASELGAEMEPLWAVPSQPDILPVPEPSRAFLLGIGIMAIAFTYRQAWMNWKRKD